MLWILLNQYMNEVVGYGLEYSRYHWWHIDMSRRLTWLSQCDKQVLIHNYKLCLNSSQWTVNGLCNLFHMSVVCVCVIIIIAIIITIIMIWVSKIIVISWSLFVVIRRRFVADSLQVNATWNQHLSQGSVDTIVVLILFLPLASRITDINLNDKCKLCVFRHRLHTYFIIFSSSVPFFFYS